MYFNISVLMSLYDKEDAGFLDESLASLSIQTLPASEIILVLDGEINQALRIVIERWMDKLPIKLVPLQENVGLSKALNIGLEYCSNEYVARMDTDDICHPERFEKQIRVFSSNEVDICGSWALDIDEYGVELRERTVPVEFEEIKRYIWSCPIIHPSVIFRKSAIQKIGSYNPNAPHRQDDYELWIRAIDSGLKILNCPEYLIYYRYPEGADRKNTIMVGLNRFKVGWRSAIKYDPSLRSILGLFFPVVRPCLPSAIRKVTVDLVRKLDPRVR